MPAGHSWTFAIADEVADPTRRIVLRGARDFHRKYLANTGASLVSGSISLALAVASSLS
jgi:hypothetical protein